MNGSFKESKITVIDLSDRRIDKPVSFVEACTRISDAIHKSFFGEDNFEQGIVVQIVDEIHKKEDEQTARDLVAQNKAMKTSIALLEKCLDEATEDRDRYRAMWLKNVEARKEYYRLYRNAKRQLEELKR